MLEFLKGYVFGKCYSDEEYILDKGEPDLSEGGYGEGYVYLETYGIPYIRVYRSWVEKYNDPTKREIRTCVGSDGQPKCWYEDLGEQIDHHNMMFEEGACVVADTPEEAIRKYLLEVHDLGLELYVRTNNRFVCINDLANDKDKWNEMLKNKKEVWYSDMNDYGEFKMKSIRLDLKR